MMTYFCARQDLGLGERKLEAALVLQDQAKDEEKEPEKETPIAMETTPPVSLL